MALTVETRSWPEVVNFSRELIADSAWDLGPMLDAGRVHRIVALFDGPLPGDVPRPALHSPHAHHSLAARDADRRV